MKIKTYGFILASIFIIGVSGALLLSLQSPENHLDSVAVNDLVYTIEENWSSLNEPEFILPENSYDLDYVILDTQGKLLLATKPGISTDENSALRHRDTILAAYDSNNVLLGKIIIYNDSHRQWQLYRNRLLADFLLMCFFLGLALSTLLFTLQRKILKPFKALDGFAKNIAAGNFNVPLPMDKSNVFGAFTESFDLMRAELATAKENESRANISKKELVASLSHDIKTPIASIKAISELMYIKANEDKTRQQLETINAKADQINLLISNMFHATMEELQELKVNQVPISSRVLNDMLTNADYQKLCEIDPLPDCLIMADPLRLSQVLDNIISNSYKYAGTNIHITFSLASSLSIAITDFGPGVLPDELPLLTQKYFRGIQAQDKQGTGIGLYISAYFMDKMHGSLDFLNTKEGFTVKINLQLA